MNMKSTVWNTLAGAKLLKGRGAVITGAASGIGLACAELFSCQGASLLLVDMDHEKLNSAVESLSNSDGAVKGIEADLTSDDDLKTIAAAMKANSEWIDILVNCAGGGLSTGFFETGIDEWRKILKLNLEAAFVLSQQFAEILKAKEGGAIVNISSLAGRSMSVTAGCHYTASKSGLLGLTRHMARELARFNIRVNALCPGPTATERLEKRLSAQGQKTQVEAQIPIGRLADVYEIASCCLFLASELSSFVTGATLDVNGGMLMV